MSNPIQQAELPPYGLCPICGAAGVARERRPGGNDRCSNGHTYPSAHARTAVAAAMARGAVPQGWRLDVDETAIYCNGRRVAALEYDGSNDSWRAACSLGQRMVDALNTAAPTPEVTQPDPWPSTVQAALARQDAELSGTGFTVDGMRVAPERVVIVHPAEATQPDPLEKLTRLQEDMGLYDEATQPTQAEAPNERGVATDLYCTCGNEWQWNTDVGSWELVAPFIPDEVSDVAQPTQAEAPSTEGLLKRASRALMIAEGALIEVSPCAEEGCRQHQTDIMRIAEEECAAVRVLIEATLATQPTQAEGRPCKVGGPCVSTATSLCACRELPPATQPTQAEAPSVTTSQTVDDLIADSERERKSAAEWQQWVERGGYDGGQQAEVPSVAALFKEAAKNIYHADDNGLSAWERRNVRELSMMLKAFKAALATQQAGQGEAGDRFDEVLQPFMALMRKELHANTGKGDRPGWLKMDANTALLEVYHHLAKLQKAVRNNDGPGIVEYAADVANMAMMVLDVCGGLPGHTTPPSPQQPEALAQQERDFMDESVSPAEREAIARLHRKVRR